ncbi:MAG: histidinol-phosphate aminotransferase family protein [Candidatus Omnitrophica bacterium]|nr:histidinol-phosphate aminotransferase family protein [Candidatus Omnitrophota bacterium]
MSKSLAEKVIKDEIKNLVRIHDGFDNRNDYLRFDKKERLFPFDKNLLEQFRKSISFEDLSAYYELGPTYRKLAKYLGVDVKQIFLAAGSDLAIKSVYEACVNKGDEVIMHSPCYAMSKVYANMFGAKAHVVALRPDWQIDFNKMMSLVNKKTKLFILENPNGFVGTRPLVVDVKRCAKELLEKDVILLLDEAYIYFDEERSQTVELIAKFPNLIITQTFSKMHGLAGLRAGYLIGNEELISYISRVRPMHEISSLSAKAMEWVLDNPKLLRDYRKEVKASKEYLAVEISRLGLEFRDAHANFIMIKQDFRLSSKDICGEFKKRKILIRRPFSEPPVSGWILVCVGGISDSRIFIKALKKIISKG